MTEKNIRLKKDSPVEFPGRGRWRKNSKKGRQIEPTPLQREKGIPDPVSQKKEENAHKKTGPVKNTQAPPEPSPKVTIYNVITAGKGESRRKGLRYGIGALKKGDLGENRRRFIRNQGQDKGGKDLTS